LRNWTPCPLMPPSRAVRDYEIDAWGPSLTHAADGGFSARRDTQGSLAAFRFNLSKRTRPSTGRRSGLIGNRCRQSPGSEKGPRYRRIPVESEKFAEANRNHFGPRAPK
jgi:hypothetical protein